MALKLITPATTEPVTLDQAKAHLRIDDTSEDSTISSLITAAREYCEAYQRRVYVTQTWELWLDSFPCADHIRIPLPPLQSVEHIKYYGADGEEYTLDTADYFADDKNEPGRVVLNYAKTWPSITLRPANGVVVRFTAGYPVKGEGEQADPAGNVPQKVKQAVLLLLGHWWENREAVGNVGKEIEFAVHALLWQDRVVLV